MPSDSVPLATLQRRCDDGKAVDDMGDRYRAEDRVDGATVISGLCVQAADTGAWRWGGGPDVAVLSKECGFCRPVPDIVASGLG